MQLGDDDKVELKNPWGFCLAVMLLKGTGSINLALIIWIICGAFSRVGPYFYT